jgi:F420-non-reducing hydrogenase iron-sulfur subunit
MSEPQSFEPKIIAYVCNWCTYLGADLAGTNRLEYPANVRIVRLPCTGRIDFNLLVKAFEQLLETLGIDMDRIHFTWISAAEGKKWQEVITEITDRTRQLGPYTAYKKICEASA